MTERFPAISPSQTSSMRLRADVIETRFGGGRRQRRPRTGLLQTEIEWQLVFAMRPRAEIEQIDSFLRARAGVEAFFWTPPAHATALFTGANWQVTPTNAHLATLRALFIAVPA